jgi:aminoglycoside 3-N-acetyltransferase
LRAKIYNLLRGAISQNKRNSLKRRIARARVRLAPLYRARYGTFTAEELCAELGGRLPPDAEILMVHCSVNDLTPMYVGDARQLLDCLVALCGEKMTLAMPAFFFAGASDDPVAYYRRRPVFDAGRQPSEMGLLSELFRRSKGVRRSLHPTHSICALGPLAAELVESHHLAETSFGEHTPFGVMAARKTAICGIGVDYFRCLTQVHAAEDLLGERYPVPLRQTRLPVQIKDLEGTLHPYDLPVEEQRTDRRLERLGRLLGPDELVQWRFHGVRLFVTSAALVTNALTAAALRGETIYDAMPIRAKRVADPVG